MLYFINNIQKKLKKSIFNEKSIVLQKGLDVDYYSLTLDLKNKQQQKITLLVKRLLLKFLIFFSKRLINKKKNIKSLLIFLKFYRYYNTFCFNNKIFFYKKYFSKKNYNIHYLKSFFLRTKQIRLKPCLHRLKAKRITFYKKYIWNKNRKFRKKNILIFNKKFFKIYTSTRFNPFIVDSILPFFKMKKMKRIRFLRKRLFDLLRRRYYYLFLHKQHIFSFPRKKKRYIFKKIISYNHKYKTYSKIFVNKKFFVYKRRRKWRRVYYIRGRRRTFFRLLFFSFDKKSFDQRFFNKYKKKGFTNYTNFIIGDYLRNYRDILAKKYSNDKGFSNRFFSKGNQYKVWRNIIYYYKWKHKTYDFHSLSFLKKNKNIKKILFGAVLSRFLYNKIFWRKRKNSRSFLLLYYNNFFFNKIFILFNSFFKSKFCFIKCKKIKKKMRKFRRRRFTVYNKRIRRRVIKIKIKKKFIRFFLILLFLKLMKKNKNAGKIFLLKNALFLSKFKKIKINLLSSILMGKDTFYFKNNFFSEFDSFFLKKNLKIISLLKKNNF